MMNALGFWLGNILESATFLYSFGHCELFLYLRISSLFSLGPVIGNLLVARS